MHEKVSGISNNKDGLNDLLNKMISSDTLVGTRMDRLGRNTK
ncbi:recombinase family protein [Carnobacterium funditum]